jgi:uncharacterized protein (TIGR02099 family)
VDGKNKQVLAGHSLKQSIFHRLSSVLWGVIVILIVLLAIYVSVGRMLSSLTGAYQKEILQELNLRVPFFIDADNVSAEWHSFTPVVVLEGLRLTLPGEQERLIELFEGRIALDVAGSIATRSPQMTLLQLNGLNLAGDLDAEGQLRIRGFEGSDAQLGEWLEAFLLNVERLALGDSHLTLVLPSGESRQFTLDLGLSREGSRRRLDGKLSTSRGLEALVLGDGIGNPFEPESFTGQLYLELEAADVGAVTDLLGDSLRGPRVYGSLGLEMWSSWDEGQPQAELRVKMDKVMLTTAGASWQVPLDRVTFSAGLVNRRRGWGLNIAGLELARDEALLQLPRLQLDVRGETLKLRAQAFPLAPLAALMADTEALPPATMDVITVLQPRGSLSAVQLDVTDISDPFADWQLRANFEEFAVEAWRGAPGVTGANGYVQLSPGSGFVVLDSQQFSMTFPTVYEDPLHFHDVHGTVYIDWDEEVVTLSSGLVEALGQEGRVPVKFGLSIPLLPSEVGIEMDLLVGLENTTTAQRTKYIPHILDEKLRAWLAASIGEGMIAQGGFLWRGSLKAKDPTLHTVQLFFNVEDTALDYHPDWPPLREVDGTVLIDNSNVSVWASTATLLDSRVRDLSVELWTGPPAELWLAVDASLAGPAADGLTVIKDSPLNQYVGGALADTKLSGEMAAEIGLLINLGDLALPPQVEVSTRFSDADLDIHPGNLPLRDISGILDYTTANGFSSRDLVARLWGQPVQVELAQQAMDEEPGTDGERKAVAMEFSTAVDMADLSQWLGLDSLAFAQGETEVVVQVIAAPGSPPLLTIESDLLGVSLDLPAPWAKPLEIERQLHIDLDLGGDRLLLGIEMAGGVAAQMELLDGQLRAASLGLEREPVPLEMGMVHLDGRTARADVAEWQRFLENYAGGGAGLAPAQEQRRPLLFAIDQLHIDQLVVGGQELGEVNLGLAEEGDQWRVTADTDWLRGELRYVAVGRSSLDIRYLDLAMFDRLDLVAEEEGEDEGEAKIIELPELAVTIEELRQGDTLLGNLAFELYSEGADIHVQNISGLIAAMQIRSSEPAGIVWQQGLADHTVLDAHLYFEDLGQSLEQLGYEQIIVTEGGSFQLALEWPGGPQHFSLQQGEGSLLVDIGMGSFPDVSGGASGTLRVVSILNLAEIVQRLSLSHMFESGIPFNAVEGEVFLRGGTIDVAKMKVEGGASSFQFSGLSDVASRRLDGELVVTLPVANNLSWVAALTAGLPVAAGVFVLSKVFESQVNRLTSAVYLASGTWDEPTVTFDRVFDDTEATGAGQAKAAPAVVLPVPPAAAQPGSP